MDTISDCLDISVDSAVMRPGCPHQKKSERDVFYTMLCFFMKITAICGLFGSVGLLAMILSGKRFRCGLLKRDSVAVKPCSHMAAGDSDTTQRITLRDGPYDHWKMSCCLYRQ